MMSLDDVIAQSDFITVHLPKTKETKGIIGREILAKAKPDLRVINVARGGIVDEAALAEAVASGQIAGAALDVFDVEPCTDSPLFALDNIVVTPHLGASTREAQDKAGDTIADMVKLALAGDFVPFAVNVSAAEANETLRPYLPLAERLGGLFASLVGQLPKQLEITAEGEIGQYDNRILTLSVLKGFFGSMSDEPVSYVNAPQMAKNAGLEIRETSSRDSRNFVNLITLRSEGHSISATLTGRNGEPRLVMIDDHATDVPPAEHATYLVPAWRAIWIPPGIEHAVTVVEAAELRTLYIHQSEGEAGPDVPAPEHYAWCHCRVLEVSPLLRELVLQMGLHADGPPAEADALARERRLGELALDELRRAAPVRLGITLPRDKRLRALCEAVIADPTRHGTLDGWAAEAGASARTVARLFREELDTSFGPWRQQVLLGRALTLAAQGRPMGLIAQELGYASASAFTAMVRRSVGLPPGRFFGRP